MTTDEKRNLIKEVVPNMVVESARDKRLFNEQAEEYIRDFDGDTFQEAIGGRFTEGKYTISCEEHFGGYEGSGEKTWVVYSLKDDETDEVIYFKLNGWYNSWNGTEWDAEIEIVKPVEVTVIKWIRKK